jgi:preprotein translocase subunit SecF
MTDILTPEETPVPAPAPQRRSALGRLYHGETSIDFYGRRFLGLGVSGALLVISIVSLLVSGLNLSLEFKGGVLWEVPTETMTESQARDILDAQGLDGATAKVQILTSKETGRSLEVQVGDQPDSVRQKVQEAFAKAVDVPTENVATQLVSSSWGSSITQKAVKALIVFLILVSLFIAWRLEWRMALAAIAAMLHDVLLSVGVYSLLGFEVTPATVVAFLTILGFSLYDTIVVFDKLDENQDRYAGYRMPYGDILNVSMNQALAEHQPCRSVAGAVAPGARLGHSRCRNTPRVCVGLAHRPPHGFVLVHLRGLTIGGDGQRARAPLQEPARSPCHRRGTRAPRARWCAQQPT